MVFSPLATLARTNSPKALLQQVSVAVDMIEITERQNISACTQVLAGLRFEKDLIRQFFREEIMLESVIYQDILLKGEQRGLQKGEVTVILRLLNRRFGSIQLEIEQQIRALSIAQLDQLTEALLDFKSQNDLVNYLVSLSPPQPNR